MGIDVHHQDQYQQDRQDKQDEFETNGMCHGIRRKMARDSDNIRYPIWSGEAPAWSDGVQASHGDDGYGHPPCASLRGSRSPRRDPKAFHG